MFTDTGGAKSWLWKSRAGSGLACLPWEWSQGICPEVLMGLGWSAGQGKAPPGCCSAREAGSSARLGRMKEMPWKGSRKCGCQAEELGLDPLGLAEPLKILDLGAVIETKL